MRSFVCLLMAGLVAQSALAVEWPQFRGVDQTSLADGAKLPVALDGDKNVAWKKPAPGRSVAGPIVVGDRVITTGSGGATGERLYVLCVDATSGNTLWQRDFWATGRPMCHPTSANAAPTPCSDGNLVYAFFSSNDLICLDLDGNLKWLRGLTVDYPAAYNDTGMASSPLVSGDTVVVQVESQGDSFAAGLNKHTGENLWRVPRAHTANWTSPLAMKAPSGAEVVLLQSSDVLSAHEPATGKELWKFPVACSTIPTATVQGDTIYLPAGGITAFRAPTDAAATITPDWKENRLSPANASPVVVGDSVYILNGAGVLVSADRSTGKVLSQTRLTGPFWATPVIAGEYLYAVNQDGLLQVVKLGEKAEVVSKHELGENVLGSPAVAHDALYIRSDSALWKIADAKK